MLSANLLVSPDGEVKDTTSLQQTLRDWISDNRKAVDKIQMVVRFGYDNAQLTEPRHPLREELDAVSAENPIMPKFQSYWFTSQAI